MPHSVTLEAGYTQKDLFFAALRVQLEEFARTQDPRCFESPIISEEDVEGPVVLSSSEKSARLVTRFYDRMRNAVRYNAWEEVRDHSPFQFNTDGKREAKLSTFSKYQLANFLSAIILQFKLDMTEFLSYSDIQEEMSRLKISHGQLMLAASNTLQAIFAPLGEMAMQDEETRIIYGFCTAAITKFCLKDAMVPQPGDTIESACDAMLRQVSLTLTQPIGTEKYYGGMLGNDTPVSRMEGALLGTELVYNEEAISIPSGFYYIPEDSFNLDESLSDEEVFKHVLLLNLNFINQVNNVDVNEVFQKIIFQRLWNAFFEDVRCPEWLINKKEIFLSMIEEKKFFAEFFENKVLSPGYTKLDIILAAIEKQIFVYGAEDLENTNNARLFEAARVSRNEDYGLTVAMSLHDSTVVNQFEAVLAGALETEEWQNLREKYLIQVADRGTKNERYVIHERGFSREQCANYFFEFAVYFQKLWLEIESIINKSRPDLQVTKELICSIAIFLNTSLIPKTAIGEQNDELRSIIAFLSRLQNNIFKGEGLIESASVNDICENIKRFACLIVAKPIGDERSYEEMISKDFVESVFDSFPDYADEFKSLDPYSIPEEAFLFDSEESFFSAYYKSLSVYLDEIDGSLCGQALYQGVLGTHWNQYVNDLRCPSWIREKKSELISGATNINNFSQFIILKSTVIEENYSIFSSKIRDLSTFSERNLESELLFFARKVAREIKEETKKLLFNNEEKQQQVITLVLNKFEVFLVKLRKDKTLNNELFSRVLSKSKIFVIDPYLQGEGDAELSVLALESVAARSMGNLELGKMLCDVQALKGAVSSELQEKTTRELLTAFDNEYKKELLSALDENTEVTKYYNEHRIQYEIMNSLISLQFFSSQESMLSILKSEKKLHEKLSEISNIAKEKLESRSLFRSPKTVEFYKSLLCFLGLSAATDVTQAFRNYLVARGDIPSNVIDIEHDKQRLFLREDQEKSFQTRFMRWMRFSVTTDDVIRDEDLHFGISATQAEVQHCYDVIMAHESLSHSQKQAFIESLRTCCLINNGAADEVWEKIDKIPAVECEQAEGLLKLLQEYEASKENLDAAKQGIILSRIEMLCPRERLQKLLEDVEKQYPKRIIGHRFFGARAYESEDKSEVTKALDLLKSDDRSIADILLGLEKLLLSEEFFKTRAYNVVSTFLNFSERRPEKSWLSSASGGRRF